MKISGNPISNWNLLAYAALAITFIELGYHLLTPLPTPAAAKRKANNEQFAVKVENKQLTDGNKALQDEIAGKLWKTPADEVGPQVMAKVAQACQAQGVTIQSFRPQKVIAVAGLTRYPFTVVMQGPFTSVATVARQLQKPETKMGVTSVQLTSADESTDQVTATVGVEVVGSTEVVQDGK